MERQLRCRGDKLPGVSRCLRTSAKRSVFCYERAAEVKKRADKTHDPAAKVDFSKMESRLLLARSCQFSDQFDAVTRENMRECKIGLSNWSAALVRVFPSSRGTKLLYAHGHASRRGRPRAFVLIRT
jgi:hypothetical protein